MPFTGFPDAALVFYEGLEADNSKTYWSDHRAAYESAVREPMQALLDELEPEFGEGKLFRPYRDVRFSKDKTPYKTAQAALVGPASGLGYYVQISAHGLVAGGGFRAHSTAQTARMRAAIDADPSGAELERAVTALARARFRLVGDSVATAPRGYPRDHPRIELLRRKELIAVREFGEPAWLQSRRVRTEVAKAWRAITPLADWAARYVGAG